MEEDRCKTASSLPGMGLNEFTVMPSGLVNAPSTFQRLNPLSATGFDVLPLRVKIKKNQICGFRSLLRFSLLIERLTSAIRRQNPRFGQFLPLWCPVRLQICLSGCQLSPQPPIVDRRSPIDDRTLSNFRSVFASVKVTPSLYFAFHSARHHFQRRQ